MADDLRIKRAYEQMLARQAKNVARNEAQGRSLANMATKGVPMEGLDKSAAADTLSNVVDQMKQKSNSSNIIKTAEGFDPRINANVRGGKLDVLKKAMDQAGDVAAPEAGLLKNAKGFSKLLPMLGIGGTALAASSIFNKANAGDIPGAAMEVADEATDYIPGVGTAKMALQSDELGAGEDKVMEELKAAQKLKSNQDPSNRRFAKIKELMR